jgi:hypothetical protein
VGRWFAAILAIVVIGIVGAVILASTSQKAVVQLRDVTSTQADQIVNDLEQLIEDNTQ